MPSLDWHVQVRPAVPAKIQRRLQRACSSVIADAASDPERFERFGTCTWVIEDYFTSTLIRFAPQWGIEYAYAIDIDAPDASSE